MYASLFAPRATRKSIALVLALAIAVPAGAAVQRDPRPADLAVPRYDHVIVIVEENEGYGAIIGNRNAPAITALAHEYGSATRFAAETHPSEPNYVAMIGGDTFGIQDDDAFYCTAHRIDEYCGNANRPGYADHTVDAPSLPSQLERAGLTWHGYFGGFDPAAPDAVFSAAAADRPAALYASKHNPFMNFRALRAEPSFRSHISPLDRLQRDLASSSLPNFAFVVPDQCDDMHGLRPGPNVPADCASTNRQLRIARGDALVGRLMRAITASPAWNSSANVAVVLTFDESEGTRFTDRNGGSIPTIVATNHGPRALADPTPYNHYALLRTIADAFGIHAYLEHAGDWSDGVRPMTRLFAR